MASATQQRAPKRKRRPGDPSAPLPHPFKRKGAAEGKKGTAEEKRRRKEEEKKKSKQKQKKEKKVQGEEKKRKQKQKKEKKVQGEESIEEGKHKEVEEREKGGEAAGGGAASSFLLSTAPVPRQLRFFLKQFESANKFKISSLELEAVKDTCIVKLSEDIDQDVDSLCKHMKDTFGASWNEVLCDGNLLEGKIDAGSPALLVISTSALRSLELLRGLRPLTKGCRPAKLFAKHLKVDDQVSLLKNRVNIASGTPSRIKKLIDMEALGLSRLSVIVLDMHKDAKGFSLFTLPQIRDEFWDLYKSHFHQRLIQGDLQICFYGPTSVSEFEKTQAKDDS